MRRKSTKSYEHLRPNDLNLSVPTDGAIGVNTSKTTKMISQSAINLAVSRNDSVSPSALSTGAPSTTRNRTTTLNKLTRYLRSSVISGTSIPAKDQSNHRQTQQPPPQIFISTKSLPESLTSTNPSILNCCPNSLTPISRHTSERNATSSDNSRTNDSMATPTYEPSQIVDSMNKSSKWKLPKYLRKFENRNNNNGVRCDKDCSVMNESSTDGNRNTENDPSYQLLPIIIQKTNTETSLCAIDAGANNGVCYDRDGKVNDTPSCSPSPRSNSNINNLDIIDVRSYISQSRSDVTPFYMPERADSCKYRNANRNFFTDISPMRRPRSKTVALTSQEHLNSKMGRDSTNELRVPNPLGRKHSQYSSPTPNNLQLPNMAPNHTSISQERLSTGDLASWVSNISDDPTSGDQSSAIAIPPNDKIHLDPIRKQSDLQLVKCVKDNAKSQQNYFIAPPISKLTLFFTSPMMEREFRAEAHQLNKRHGPSTIAFPIYNTYFDIFNSIVIFSTVSMGMFFISTSKDFQGTAMLWIWRCLFGIFTFLEIFAFILFTKKIFQNQWKSSSNQRQKSEDTEMQKQDIEQNAINEPIKPMKELQKTMSDASSITVSSTLSASYRLKKYVEDKIINSISTWYRWHLSLGLLMSLPAILTITHFLISVLTNDQFMFGCHYGFLMLVCIVHFCNFTQLNCWMRNILALVAASAFIGGISIYQVSPPEWILSPTLGVSKFPTQNNFSQPSQLISSDGSYSLFESINNNSSLLNRTLESANEINTRPRADCVEDKFDIEIYLDFILLLLLVWFLNREFEICYRFAFYSSSIAEKDKIRVQQMKNQADLLLQNIIPKHVADHLKNTAKYSENHFNVAIIFASLINFNELYDESYLGGREYLRVLNELIGDFDELLSRPEFSCVEKIKTIGSTFMAASGLDDSLRDANSNAHVNALMEFAMAMQEVVAAFNKDLLEFDLILRIGFNVGDVTAGVIGTSKLHYDIWGDAVNVSSRMDSTGLAGEIQVGKDCISFLDDPLYEFVPRGKVFVKGKDDMEVYLVKRKTSKGDDSN